MIKYIKHKICHCNHFKYNIQCIKYIHNTVQSSPLSISKTFLSPQIEILYPLSNNSHSPFPQFLVTSNLLSVYMNLPIVDILCKWNYIIFVLLCLDYFTWHNAFKVHPCRSLYQNIIPFYGWIIFHCMDRPHFVYLFISWWPFGLYPLWGYRG